MKRRLNLAYGSNIGDQMLSRCPGAKFLGTSVLDNWELLFAAKEHHDFGVATIRPCQGSYVPVVIWELTPEHERVLDRYEGVDQDVYHKETFWVWVEIDGEFEETFAYIMTGGEKCLPNHFYYTTIISGYIQRGFNLAVLTEAVRNSCVVSLECAASECVSDSTNDFGMRKCEKGIV